MAVTIRVTVNSRRGIIVVVGAFVLLDERRGFSLSISWLMRMLTYLIVSRLYASNLTALQKNRRGDSRHAAGLVSWRDGEVQVDIFVRQGVSFASAAEGGFSFFCKR